MVTQKTEPITSLDELEQGDIVCIDRPCIKGLPWVVQSARYVPLSTREFAIIELSSPTNPNCTYRYYEKTLHGIVKYKN